MKSIAEIEGVTSKTIAYLCLQLIANESKDSGTIGVCKEIVESGTCKHNTQLLERKSSFLQDFHSVGKLKYWELRRFLKEEQVFIHLTIKLRNFVKILVWLMNCGILQRSWLTSWHIPFISIYCIANHFSNNRD